MEEMQILPRVIPLTQNQDFNIANLAPKTVILFFTYFYFLATPQGLRDLSSPTGPSTGKIQSLNHAYFKETSQTCYFNIHDTAFRDF